MSCAATSVSVSDGNSTPSATSSALSVAKFSTMPLWITASLPATCGCAFTSVGPAVGGPAGVPDRRGRRRQRVAGPAPRPGWPACRPSWRSRACPSGLDQRDAGGVVAAVLEPPQTLQHHVQGAIAGYLASDVPDDSAHGGESTGAARDGLVARPRAQSSRATLAQPGHPLRRPRPRRLGAAVRLDPAAADGRRRRAARRPRATRSTWPRSTSSTGRSPGCSTCTSRRPAGCTPRRARSCARTSAAPRSSSASPARSPSASRPPPACCASCSPAGPRRPASSWSPPTASSTRTPSSSAAG